MGAGVLGCRMLFFYRYSVTLPGTGMAFFCHFVLFFNLLLVCDSLEVSRVSWLFLVCETFWGIRRSVLNTCRYGYDSGLDW
ncbi:hypothetical protein K440DRAFT_379809 [Wilcoxina mikolae CBS 423.85]|nr:hypothetical protein K440DRAFT_379809 [Wilcoxina mikolae CBS 423.85]